MTRASTTRPPARSLVEGGHDVVASYLLAATSARPRRLVVLSSSLHRSGDATGVEID